MFQRLSDLRVRMPTQPVNDGGSHLRRSISRQNRQKEFLRLRWISSGQLSCQTRSLPSITLLEYGLPLFAQRGRQLVELGFGGRLALCCHRLAVVEGQSPAENCAQE